MPLVSSLVNLGSTSVPLSTAIESTRIALVKEIESLDFKQAAEANIYFPVGASVAYTSEEEQHFTNTMKEALVDQVDSIFSTTINPNVNVNYHIFAGRWVMVVGGSSHEAIIELDVLSALAAAGVQPTNWI